MQVTILLTIITPLKELITLLAKPEIHIDDHILGLRLRVGAIFDVERSSADSGHESNARKTLMDNALSPASICCAKVPYFVLRASWFRNWAKKQ